MPIVDFIINGSGATKGARQVTKAFDSIANKGRSLIGGVFSPMNSAIAAIGGTAAVVGITKITDQFEVMSTQLQYLTGNAQDAEEIEKRLYQISRQTGTSIEDNAGTYVKLNQAMAMTNLSADENLRVIQGLNTLMVQTGTSGAQASAAMLQLSQALTSGKLQGDEFRSMAENAPGVLNAMSEAMGIARSDLKQMATDGELTSERLGTALLQIADNAEGSMDELPKTVARGWNSVVLAFSEAWDEINDRTGIMGMLFNALEGLANWIEDNTYRFAGWIDNLVMAIQANWPTIDAAIDDMWSSLIGFMDGVMTYAPGVVDSVMSISNALATLIGWATKAIDAVSEIIQGKGAIVEFVDRATAGVISGTAAAVGTLAAEGSIGQAWDAYTTASQSANGIGKSSTTNINILTPVSPSNVETITRMQATEAALI